MKLRYEPGQTVFLDLLFLQPPVRATSRLIGFREPSFLLLDPPVKDRKPQRVNPGDVCVVRLLHEGSMVGFRASVVRTLVDPFPLLVLAASEEYEELAIREHDRLECDLPSQLAVGEATLHGRILNLSHGGCQVAYPIFNDDPNRFIELLPGGSASGGFDAYRLANLTASLEPGSSAALTFTLPPPASQKPLEVTCQLRWRKREGNHLFVGLKFEELATAARDEIKRIIEHQNRFFRPSLRPVS